MDQSRVIRCGDASQFLQVLVALRQAHPGGADGMFCPNVTTAIDGALANVERVIKKLAQLVP
jgi:hypothetical protein